MDLARVDYHVDCASDCWEVIGENNNVSASCGFGYGQSDSEKLGACGCIFACRSLDGGDLVSPHPTCGNCLDSGTLVSVARGNYDVS